MKNKVEFEKIVSGCYEVFINNKSYTYINKRGAMWVTENDEYYSLEEAKKEITEANQ